jgi:hypothetical protein
MFESSSGCPTSKLQTSVLLDDETGTAVSNPQHPDETQTRVKEKNVQLAICNQRIIGAGNQFPVTFTLYAVRYKNVQRSLQTAVQRLVTDCANG